MIPDPDLESEPKQDLIDTVAEPAPVGEDAENIEEIGEPFAGNNA